MIVKGDIMARVSFDGSRINFESLINYGFERKKDLYIYTTDILSGQFEMSVEIGQNGEIDTCVRDKVLGDEYVLHLTESEGTFVGAVRNEYERVLSDIRKNCYIGGSYDNSLVSRIEKYAEEKYGSRLEFLWEKSPDSAILRRKDSGKWYAVIMTVGMDKLGFDSDSRVCVVNLHTLPERVSEIVDGVSYLPAYHMNKKSWYTIRLDGSIGIEEIFPLIDESYALAVKK